MRTVMRSFVVTAALALGLAGAQVPLSIATGGTGGVYYPVGGGYAQIIDQYVDGYTATVEATNASVDNVAFISRGDADIALADDRMEIWKTFVAGQAAFEKEPA